LAYLSTALAVAGVIVPGLPTTPFVLAAAWAARRGCPPVDRWLHGHRQLGPLLMHWETQRAVPTRAKALAVALLALSWSVLAHRSADARVAFIAALLLGAVAVFVATRPAPRPLVTDD
jgi:hypothetical protein